MKAETLETPLTEVAADLALVGLFEEEELPPPFAGAPGGADAKGGFKSASFVYAGSPARLLVVGLGKRGEFTAERARVAAAAAWSRAKAVEPRSIAWELPEEGDPPAVAAALVEGTIAATFDFDRFKPAEEEKVRLESIAIVTAAEVEEAVRVGLAVGEAQNRARELQSLPANFATPSHLAERAEQVAAAHEKVTVEVLGREEIAAAGMGGLVAVSQGTPVEPKLITLTYEGRGGGERLGLVGKSVTFDTGGISIKPSAGMEEMKMDMSGGAAVLEAMAAIAELGLPIDVVAVLPATENMPSGTAIKPGDVITQLNGKTVEVINTDAEGRLILADALVHCARQGADRIVDLATLTGAVLVGLGSTYAALISNDDALAAQLEGAGERSGELVWRLPLHEEYKELTRGTITDLVNAAAKRKAGTIYAGSFLEEFCEGRPWAHVDIAGTAWDTGREYWGSGPTGFGVHLLVALARTLGQDRQMP